ncbi:MAG TPA: FtsX-like permease family protein [Steroidobacteraceae bacterium]
MFRNYLAATVRNLLRNRLFSSIGILALGIGMAVALICALLIRQDLSYEHFIPGYARTYLAASSLTPAGRQTMYGPETPGFVAAGLKNRFPEIEAVARLVPGEVRIRYGDRLTRREVYWADPAVFKVLPLPVRRGSLRDALHRPDGAVLPASVAAQFFGSEDPIGRTLNVNDHLFTVRAVIDDLPSNATNLKSGIFLSGLGEFSEVSQCDRNDVENLKNGAITLCGFTYFRLRPGADIGLVHQGEEALVKSLPSFGPMMSAGYPSFRIDEVNLFEGLSPGARSRLAEIGAVGLLILIAGAVVYVNLATARASRRAKEVGVRKVCGASNGQLLVQFMGEALMFALFAALLAVSLTELMLPFVDRVLERHLEFSYWRRPGMLAWIALGGCSVGIAAGIYPALVLSAFRPKDVLKGLIALPYATFVRQSLVVVQFAILIALVIAALVVFRQRDYATHEALRLRTDQMLALAAPCADPLLTELRRLPGVASASCSDSSLFTAQAFTRTRLLDGNPIVLNVTAVDFSTFEAYGIQVLAGAIEPRDSDGSRAATGSRVIINESAVKALGFASPQAAVGQVLPIADEVGEGAAPAPERIVVAVIPDFALEVVKAIRPTVYSPVPHQSTHIEFLDRPTEDLSWTPSLIHLKLKGHDIPETLKGIDRTWKALLGSAGSDPTPLRRFFVQQYVENLYQTVLSQAKTFAAFSLVAVMLACLGLLGLAAATAEKRMKEIGVRKALGAGRWDILSLLLKHFSIPVLWASLLAWPVSAWLLHRWLEGFANHIELGPWLFVQATAVAFLANFATVTGYTWSVAAAPPTLALRYQ